MAPELIVRGPYSDAVSTPKEDVWAVGVVLIQLALRHPLWPHLRSQDGPLDPMRILERTLEYHAGEVLNSEQRMVGGFAMRRLRTFATGPCDNLSIISVDTAAIIAACLNPTAKCRPTAAQLLSHPGFPPCIPGEPLTASWKGFKCGKLPSALEGLDLGEANIAEKHGLRLAARRNGSASNAGSNKTLSMSIAANPLEAWVLKDVYYLWSLLDIGLQDEFIRKGYISQLPAIQRLPKMSRQGEKDIADTTDHSMIYAPHIYLLDTDALSKRLSEADLDLFPRVVPIDGIDNDFAAIESKMKASQDLPLLIRERDLDYQHARLTMFRRLLRGYPYTRDRLLKEALTDIPSIVRCQIWAVILEVPHDIEETYKSIDKESPGATDHQLAVDIPRCHQYDPLLSSPAGHAKFRRVLKAWISSNPDLVYWQGLDSVSAPFLVNSFNDEALAFGCLHSFVRRYLGHFFLKDNSQTMQECLAIFVHMISYHDPELGYHMHSIGFIPDLFAIPWFLTCFAHVFPLDKIMHIWDSLILSGPTMIVLIGVAILKSIRDVLLSFNFEQCILLFSDAPDVDVEAIIVDARALFSITRPSLCARQFSGIPSELKESNYQVPDIITLKTQICPCVSIHDFMELTVLGDGSDGRRRKSTDSEPESDRRGSGPALAIDIRPLSEYLTGSLETDHVNIPFEEAFRENGEDIKEEHLQAIRPWKGKPIIIVEKRMKNAPRFAEALIKEKFPKVSILNGGVSVLRVQGLLHTTAGSQRRVSSRGTLDGGPTPDRDDLEMQLAFGESFGEAGGYYDNI
eukprot:m.29215 g.29215  ORF g.29215 m.29215 type:complete len:798 (+) comp4577_c1_seq1:238-2631(+)